jgi:Ni/Co efflux regulator RcnB
MRGRPGGNSSGPSPTAGRHHLPSGIAAPGTRHDAPIWRGRSWNIGDFFILAGFEGQVIYDTASYELPPPRPGTHWIYVDGFFLMVGNRTGRIFAEIPADY